MITIKTMEQIDRMRKAGRLLALCHQQIARRIRPGVTTREIDSFVEQFLDKHGAIPEQKGYMGYPYATCASVNDVICHGFPNDQPLKNGDIVTIDMVVNLNGWLADSAWSFTPCTKIAANHLAGTGSRHPSGCDRKPDW
jgi:methionyl aminopeptidase